MKSLLILAIFTSSSTFLLADKLPAETKAQLEHLDYLLKPKVWKLPSDIVTDLSKDSIRMANLVFKEKHGDSDFHSSGGSGMGASKGEDFWIYYFPNSDTWRIFSKGKNSMSATGNSWTFPSQWKGPKQYRTTEDARRYEIKTTYKIIKKENEVFLAQRRLHDKKTGQTIIQQVGFSYTTKPK